MRNIISFIFFLGYLSGQAQSLTGTKAPSLQWTKIFQVPGEADPLHELKNKTVVIEFWATWCSPCIAAIGHLNELSSQFADSNVQFVSVSDEAPERVEAFLRKRQMRSWVISDTTQFLSKAFDVHGLPKTIVINPLGFIVYEGRPEKLSPELIQNVRKGMAYKEEAEPEAGKRNLAGSWQPGMDPVYTAGFGMADAFYPYQHSIRKSRGGGGFGIKTNDTGLAGITLLNMPISLICAFTFSLPSANRVINQSAISDTLKWDIIFSRKKGFNEEKAKAEVWQSCTQAFSIVAKDTVVNQKVLVPSWGEAVLITKADAEADEAVSKTYKSLEELFQLLELKKQQIVLQPAQAGELYLDVYEVFTEFRIYKMSAAELQQWLEQKGIVFAEQNKQVMMTVLQSE